MWGVATSSWFVANKVLSISVAFPIVTTGPAVVASLLGVLVFREITVSRSYFSPQNECFGGYTGISLSLCPSIRMSVFVCVLNTSFCQSACGVLSHI